MIYETYLEQLKAAGWKLELDREPCELPQAVRGRYRSLPSVIAVFLINLRVLSNQAESAWFLTGGDYAGRSGSAFRWNEFELVSLEAAEDDTEWQSQIKHFWDRHFPIFLSVKAGYAYFAVQLDGPNPGCIVHGMEPEFEETTIASQSLGEFLGLLVQAARGELGDSVIAAAV